MSSIPLVPESHSSCQNCTREATIREFPELQDLVRCPHCFGPLVWHGPPEERHYADITPENCGEMCLVLVSCKRRVGRKKQCWAHATKLGCGSCSKCQAHHQEVSQ